MYVSISYENKTKGMVGKTCDVAGEQNRASWESWEKLQVYKIKP